MKMLERVKKFLKNVPLISDLFLMIEIGKSLGAKIKIDDHTLTIGINYFKNHQIS